MKKSLRVAVGIVLLATAGGCAQFSYYLQAMQGQMSLMSEAKPIDDWLADPQVKDDLKERLRRVREIRRFAAQELGLPDNGSYKSYADLKRPYVMWNVVATPKLDLKPVQWCFPIAGCVDYRGYYDKGEAQAFADSLRSQGYDVRVSGVPAYSTLGWFNDPVLSTFISYPEAEVARMVFHELAHQVAYAQGDTQFNESFATAVEEVGVARWIAAHGDDKVRESYARYRQRKDDFLGLLSAYRKQLDENYKSLANPSEKLRRKDELLRALEQDYRRMKDDRWDGYAGYDRWFAEPLTNAHFALVSTYHDLVPAFRRLLAEQNGFPMFYSQVKKLSVLDRKERRTRLSSQPLATAAAQ